MAPDTVPAIWLGPFKGERGPGVADLEVGDECQVSPELLESGHWEAVTPPTLPAPAKPLVTGATGASTNGEGS